MSAVDVKFLKRAIVRHAEQCETSLRLALFAESEPTLGARMATSLRKLAALHSHNAFACAHRLAAPGGVA